MAFLLTSIFLPVVGGALLPLFKPSDRRRAACAVGLALLTSLSNLALITRGGSLSVIEFAEGFVLKFGVDGLSRVFLALISVLWPLATLYAVAYMKGDARQDSFFAYYVISYGVTNAIATAGNLFTLYVFYEFLTLATLPLVTHNHDAQSVHAGRQYLYYSISGAALGFIALMFINAYGVSGDFQLGGVLNPELAVGHEQALLIVFALAFLGFGAKAAVFPLSNWLPVVSVAPTPVTALLHAVAVVKAGAFAILRVTYYSFGADFLRGTWAQYAVVILASFTIVYGSVMAVREQHIKRRLAYSTVSNLSYILLGAALMIPEGLTGAMAHTLFHGVMKITLFFCAGALMTRGGIQYVQEMRGFGRKMPLTMVAFTVGAVALIGVPPLCGFAGKWTLLTACATLGGPLGYIGGAALIISTLLTTVYMFSMVVPAWMLPADGAPLAREAEALMTAPMLALCALMLALGVCAAPILSQLASLASGGM